MDTPGCEKRGGQIHCVGTAPNTPNNTSRDRPPISSRRALSEPPVLTQWWIAQKLPTEAESSSWPPQSTSNAANEPVNQQNNIQGRLPTKKSNYSLGSSYREGGNGSKQWEHVKLWACAFFHLICGCKQEGVKSCTVTERRDDECSAAKNLPCFHCVERTYTSSKPANCRKAKIYAWGDFRDLKEATWEKAPQKETSQEDLTK